MKKLILAALILASSSVMAQEPEKDLNAAAATVLGQSLRQAFFTLQDAGVELNQNIFLDYLQKVFNGDTVAGYDLESADAAIRRASNPSYYAGLPMADEDAENQWVADKMNLPRTEMLEGGVVLQHLVDGSGEFVPPHSTVSVMYEGKLSNGTVFDSTAEPFDLPLDHIIKGLAAAMQLMRVGGTYRVFIPPMQGYGHEPVMDVIPGNSALDFTISVIKI